VGVESRAHCDDTTHNLGASVEPVIRRVARGSLAGAEFASWSLSALSPTLRRAVAHAIGRGLPQEISSAYLKLARALVGAGRIAAATAELREGIDIVTAGRGVRRGCASHAALLVIELDSLQTRSRERMPGRRRP